MKNKKFTILIIIVLIIFITISLATAMVIEYYYAKSEDRIPLLAIKTESISKQYTEYKSLFYKMYKCYSDLIIVQGLNKEEPYCNRIIKYDESGYYINYHNIKISKKDFQLIFDVSSTFFEIDKFTTYQDLENSKLIADEYKRNIHITKEVKKVNKENISIEVFPEFIQINEYGDYDWKFQTDNPEYYKCMKNSLFKDYDGEICTGEWNKLEYSDKWCELAKNNSIYSINIVYKDNCK